MLLCALSLSLVVNFALLPFYLSGRTNSFAFALYGAIVCAIALGATAFVREQRWRIVLMVKSVASLLHIIG